MDDTTNYRYLAITDSSTPWPPFPNIDRRVTTNRRPEWLTARQKFPPRPARWTPEAREHERKMRQKRKLRHKPRRRVRRSTRRIVTHETEREIRDE